MSDEIRQCARCGVDFTVSKRANARARETRRFCSLSCACQSQGTRGPDWFTGKYDVDRATGCWLWNRWRDDLGYGRAKYGRKRWLAHRLSFHLHKEPVSDQLVCHRCDTPACINPDHLFLGTHLDNTADRVAKGRSGSRGGPVIPLSDDARADILANCRPGATGASIKAFAAKHGVTTATVRRALAERAEA